MKKKLLSLILAVCVICSTLVTMSVTTVAADSNVVEIGTAEQLQQFNTAATTGDFAGKTVKLTADIDASGITWAAIPTFAGTFDGNGKTISKLALNNVFGLFNNLTGTVKNVTFNTCTFAGGAGIVGFIASNAAGATVQYVTMNNCTVNKNAGWHGGGLIGATSGTTLIDNCRIVGGTITFNGNNTVRAGAFVGKAGGTVTVSNCFNSATMTGSGETGGIVGVREWGATAIIQNCINEGAVTSGQANAGGILAVSVNGGVAKILNCTNKGAVSAATSSGGMVGLAQNDTYEINGCVNMGTITSTGGDAGGIVGAATYGNPVTITNCVNQGAVNGVSSNAGGIIGRDASAGLTQISNCMNAGDVTVTEKSDKMAGGIVGWLTTSLDVVDCLNTGKITGHPSSRTSGIIGYMNFAGAVSLVNCINAGKINSTHQTGASNLISYAPNAANSITIESSYYLDGVCVVVPNTPNIAVGAWSSVGANDGTFHVIYPAAGVNFTFQGGVHNVDENNGNTLQTQQYNRDLINAMFTGRDNANIPAGTNYKTGAVKTEAELSDVAGAAFLMTAGFDFTNDWYITSGIPVPTKLALTKQALDEDAEVVFKGYQEKLVNGAETASSIRLVAGLNSLDFANTGYELSSLDNGKIFGLPAQTTSTVYTSLNAYVEGVNTPITAEKFESAYLSAITVNDLPVDRTLFLIVKPFVTNYDGSVSYGSTVILVIENGTVTSQYS